MSYPTGGDESSSSAADSDIGLTSSHKVISQTSSASATSQTTLTITREGTQTPTVLAVHTSSTLPKPGAKAGGDPNESGAVVSNVMTSQQAHKRRTASYEEITGKEDIPPSTSASASSLKDFECPVGDRYKQPTNTLEQVRFSVKRVVEHIYFRAFTIILILIDLGIVIASVVKFETAENKLAISDELYKLDVVAMVFSSYFMIEVFCRIFAETPRVFFRQILEIIDAVVVLISFIVVLVDFVVDKGSVEYINNNSSVKFDYSKIIGALRLIRLVRFVMLLRVMVTQRKKLLEATRLVVSENKRRYQLDGFDLDLCYVTDHMIAMSFPSSGFMSFYRNPIEEVSRFFKTKFYGAYRIYNCCSEIGYNETKYFDNCVVRILIDDHNVPSLQQIVDFVKDVERWMNVNKDNVIAIHCKGGKGRTGTMVSVWLLHTGAFSKADDALEYFGSRRTDLSVDSKFQGVETPSQSRYVNYYEKMLSEHEGKIPEKRTIRPTKVSVSGLRGIGDGNGKDLSMQLVMGGDVIYEAKFGTDTNCTTVFERDTATITASLINSPDLTGDIKVRFEATSNIPCAYDGCPWFFWFNTSFIEDNRISLGREELDNPHQRNTWKLYKEDFRVTLEFNESV